jgi:hypothetical protein
MADRDLQVWSSKNDAGPCVENGIVFKLRRE